MYQTSKFWIYKTNFGSTKYFAGASDTGYGTVTYILIKNDKGDKHCSFLMAKSRVAPLKQITIPRMELTAAVVAVKIDKMMRHYSKSVEVCKHNIESRG